MFGDYVGSVGFINAKITCKDCGSQVVSLARIDDRHLFSCQCQRFDMNQINIFDDIPPEQMITKIRKAFDALHWELEALE